MLKPKFKIGQKVYRVTSRVDTKEIPVKCDTCDSTGRVRIVGKDGDFKCPTCHGHTCTKTYNPRYVVEPEGIIAAIYTKEIIPKYEHKVKSCINYTLEEGFDCNYATLIPENRLFATKEEAMEFCENNIPGDDL